MKNEIPQKVKALCDQNRFEEAWELTEKWMGEEPNKANPAVLGAYVLWKLKRLPLAYHLGVRATQLAPQEPAAWLNLGIAAQEMWMTDEAELCYKTAFRLASQKHEQSMAKMNLSAMYIDTGKWVDAEREGREALKYNPDNPKSKANVGFGLLGQRKWEGWDYYSYSLGLSQRIKFKFGEEPDWDGSKGKTVAFYGEQGLGDEISFASMIPDAIKDCKKVIIDCDSKLEGLFKRSFPQAKVYGTRKAKEEDGVQWDKEDWQMDASSALGELGKFYRRTDESFTGEPYLVADPDRRSMWRHLFDNKKKPVIGLAWTGGIPQTGLKFRTLTLEMLKPILSSVDAHWVSLQYKDASQEIADFKKKNPAIDIQQYPWATLTKDYDDTAAVVAELDLVICMQTAVAHLAGGLGKDCWVLLPKHSQWRYGSSGETIPWYKSLRVFRQTKEWSGPINEVVGRLRKRYGLREAA